MPRSADDLLKEAGEFARGAGVQIIVFATALALAGLAIEQHYSARAARAIRAPDPSSVIERRAPEAEGRVANLRTPRDRPAPASPSESLSTVHLSSGRLSPGRPVPAQPPAFHTQAEVRSGCLAAPETGAAPPKPVAGAASSAPEQAEAKRVSATGVGHCIDLYLWRRAQLSWRDRARRQVETRRATAQKVLTDQGSVLAEKYRDQTSALKERFGDLQNITARQAEGLKVKLAQPVDFSVTEKIKAPIPLVGAALL